MTTVTWRYSLPSLPDHSDSWSVVFIDSRGVVSIVSDYGNWGHCWPVRHTGHDDIREFLLRCDWDYVARKLGTREDLQVFDGEATQKSIRRDICEARRHRCLDREQARERFDAVPEANTLFDFYDWYQHSDIEDPDEIVRYRMSFGLEHWVKVSFERLKAQIREQLATERLHRRTEAAGTPS